MESAMTIFNQIIENVFDDERRLPALSEEDDQ